ncbi:MAG TPA: hypothetical protein VLA52_10880 [Thermohalobaculum sp.]|nr:hypothetical protein [Thermohalobaculum sp.]
MTMLLKARKFAADAPREALADTLGFAAVCVLIFAGFMAPAFF